MRSITIASTLGNFAMAAARPHWVIFVCPLILCAFAISVKRLRGASSRISCVLNDGTSSSSYLKYLFAVSFRAVSVFSLSICAARPDGLGKSSSIRSSPGRGRVTFCASSSSKILSASRRLAGLCPCSTRQLRR